MKEEKVKCIDCGFLTLRRWTDKQFVEADNEYRKTTSLPDSGPPIVHEHMPLCFRRQTDLRKEIGQAANDKFDVKQKDILSIIQKARLCHGFRKWCQGFTPKEHLEMLDREEWRRWQADESRKNRNARIIEAVVFFVIACLFVLLGYFLGS